MRIVISESSGKSYQVELPKEKEAGIYGKRVGEELDGNLIGVVETVHDITEHKRVEQVRHESEQRYRTLFETMAQGVVSSPSTSPATPSPSWAPGRSSSWRRDAVRK